MANYNRHVDDLVLCTINTSELYAKHMDLAKDPNTTIEDWQDYVKRYAIPTYKKAQREPYFGLYISEIEEVARELADYYSERVKEGA